MKRRRLRRLVPDAELFWRRAAGEPLRALAADYDVGHTTLSRFFERPEAAKQLREAASQLQAERRAIAARRSAERRQEQEVRRRAREQKLRERAGARRFRAVVSEQTSRSRRSRSPYAQWLDERDADQPLRRVDRRSHNDEVAARVVAAGGGMQELIDATDLRTRENVLGLIDPEILARAFDNDVLRGAEPPPG